MSLFQTVQIGQELKYYEANVGPRDCKVIARTDRRVTVSMKDTDGNYILPTNFGESKFNRVFKAA